MTDETTPRVHRESPAPPMSQLHIARRWNSFTPSLPGTTSVGGGYFVRHYDTGIAIDPGFNFLDNLQACGYSLDDIDVVVMTHNHIDHTGSFEALLMLLHRLNRTRLKLNPSAIPHTVTVIFNPGCELKFREQIAMAEQSDMPVLDRVIQFERDGSGSWKTEHFEEERFAIHPLRTFHRELDRNCANGVGVVFELLDDSGTGVSFAITSDTAYYDLENWGAEDADTFMSLNTSILSSCSVVVGHLGTVRMEEILTMAVVDEMGLAHLESQLVRLRGRIQGDDRLASRALAELRQAGFPTGEIASLPEEIVEILRHGVDRRHLYDNHLGVYGVFHLFRELCSSTGFELGVISEFGEEVGSYRHRVARALNDVLQDNLGRRKVLTGDIGLTISLHTQPVECGSADCTSRRQALIQCSSCQKYFCSRCINEVCIKHRAKAMVYFCGNQSCLRQEYAPPISRVPKVMLSGFGPNA